jgi:putative sterol carrier protein
MREVHLPVFLINGLILKTQFLEIIMAVMTKETAEELFGDLWAKMLEGDFGEQLKENGITIKFEVSDPKLTMFVDENGPLFGDEAESKTAVVIMKMALDTAHKFWLKDLNVPKALALRKIKAKGPIGKVLQLLPLLKPGQAMYPDYCKKFNVPGK